MTHYDILNKSGRSPTFHLLDVLALYSVRHAADIPLVSLQACHFGVPPCGNIPAQLDQSIRSSYQKTYNNYKNAVRGENLYRRQTCLSTKFPPLVVSNVTFNP